MKAVTIYQPYASLIACWAKKYETRSWATKYRGQIAIHAGLRKPHSVLKGICWTIVSPILKALRIERGELSTLPLGCIIATAELVGCHPIEKHPLADRPILGTRGGNNKITANELLFGDWTPGRYAWELTNIQMLPEPIPAKGKQGLWNWEAI